MKELSLERFYNMCFEYPLLCIGTFIIITSLISTQPNYVLFFLLFGVFLNLRYIYVLALTESRCKKMGFTLLVLSYIGLCLLCPSWYLPLLAFYLCNPLRIKSNIRKPFLVASTLVCSTHLLVWITYNNNYTFPQFLLHTIYLIGICVLFLIIEKLLLHYIYGFEQTQDTLNRLALHSLNEQNLIKQLALSKQAIEQNARLEERELISRNIHNVVGHTITSSIMALDAADLLIDIDIEKAKEKYNIANKRMHESLESIRLAVRLLTNDDGNISISDLYQTLNQSIDEFTLTTSKKVRHNLHDTHAYDSSIMLPSTYVEFLNGVLLEAFSNGIRHGNATAFIVLLSIISSPLSRTTSEFPSETSTTDLVANDTPSQHLLTLTVEDNGTGIQNKTTSYKTLIYEQGFGIKKIEDFVLKNGGSIQLMYEEGFSLKLTLPLHT